MNLSADRETPDAEIVNAHEHENENERENQN